MANPFLWYERHAMGIPSSFATDPKFCTPAYRAWSAMSDEARLKVPWETYRVEGPRRPVRRVSLGNCR